MSVLVMGLWVKGVPTIGSVLVLRSVLTKIEIEILIVCQSRVEKVIFYKTLSSELDQVKHEKSHLCFG